MNDRHNATNCSSCGARIPKNERQVESGETYSVLKEWRKTKLVEKGVSAFIVASNRTLREISIILPKTRDQMLDIHGIGEKRFQEYDFNEVLDIIKDRQEESYSFIEFCDDCLRGEAQTSGSPAPTNPQIGTFDGGSNCPTCGKPGWDGVHRGYSIPAFQNWPTLNPEQFKIHSTENRDPKDDQIANANGTRVLDVEVRGITLEILSRALDEYLQKSSVGRVFDFEDYSSPFIYSPEWISRPLEPMGEINVPGFWRCKFSHTTANKGECHLCGEEVKNPSHYLCYPCWKSQN